MQSAFALIAASAMLLLGAACMTVLLRPRSLLDALVILGVVGSAAVAVIVAGTGAVGMLRPGVALAVDAAFMTAAAAVVASSRAARACASEMVARTGGLLTTPRLRAEGRAWPFVVIAVTAAGLAWQGLVALLLPPFAFDAITYHLTIVATWLQEERLAITPLSLCCARYPANPELIFAWSPLFHGTDALVDAAQLPFAVLAGLAVAGLARSAGLGALHAAAAGALFVATPVVLAQASTNYVDVVIVAWALAALHLLVRFAAGEPARLLVPAGLATGLVLGTKGVGVFWAAVLTGCALVLLALAVRRCRLPRRSAVRGASAFLACVLALGAFWYVRNWIDTGNPLYPLDIRAGGVTIFEGPIPLDDVIQESPWGAEPSFVSVGRAWAADLLFWRRAPYEYQQRIGGLGPLWPWLGLPLLVPLILMLARRRSPAAVATIVVAVVFLVQPFKWWSRFTLQLSALAAIAIVAAVAWAPRSWMRRGVAAAALVLAIAGVVLTSYEVNPAGQAHPLAATDLLRLVDDPGDRRLGRIFYPEYRFLEKVPERATVMVDLPATDVRFVYPLFGPSYRRRVVPAAGAPPAGAWVVTAVGRPLDRAMARRDDFTLAFDERGVRVWAPSAAAGRPGAEAGARP